MGSDPPSGWSRATPPTHTTRVEHALELVGMVPCLPGRRGRPGGLLGPSLSEMPIRKSRWSETSPNPFTRGRNSEGPVMARKDGGGRKEAWDPATRDEAVRKALVSGPEAASRATGVPSGTVRSWLRRRAKREELDDDVEARLAAVKAEGAAIV